jgi:hypothetical protein
MDVLERDVNPYESPIVRAELASPATPSQQRMPLLALIFLLLDLPIVAGTTIPIAFAIANWSSYSRDVGMAGVVIVLPICVLFAAASWWVLLICIRELASR